MTREKKMRCPHCREVGAIVWVGFGKDWVLCHFCQRRIRWAEVQTSWLVEDDDDAWTPGGTKAVAYN